MISDQLSAFQEDDFATAFTFASPMIRVRLNSERTIQRGILHLLSSKLAHRLR
ncbi:MAG: DUF4864 domain-containing protein [Pseudomonadota bacterium]